MNTNIFEKILNKKISNFVSEFSYDSKDFFNNNESQLIHPGEFGIYREKIVKDLLKCILPQRLEIGTGFLINKEGKISTQCDIIIYDKNICPNIENHGQTFFPIECVVAIGEIKSDLTTTKFKESLKKLQKNKKIREAISSNPKVSYRKAYNSIIDVKKCNEDSIVTFLICNKIDEINNPIKTIKNAYNINDYSKHNLILSIEDGTFMYIYNNNPISYPLFDNNKSTDIFIPANPSLSYDHIVKFLYFLSSSVSQNTIFIPEIYDYISLKKMNCIIE